MNKVNRVIFSALILLALDCIYLSLSKCAFESMIVRIQRVVMKVKMPPVILCYILLVFALNFFILSKKRPIYEAFLLGFVIYGVFDTTNYAIFKKWDLNLAIMDAIWGGVLFSLTAFIIYSF